jgi:hypothetical protein
MSADLGTGALSRHIGSLVLSGRAVPEQPRQRHPRDRVLGPGGGVSPALDAGGCRGQFPLNAVNRPECYPTVGLRGFFRARFSLTLLPTGLRMDQPRQVTEAKRFSRCLYSLLRACIISTVATLTAGT